MASRAPKRFGDAGSESDEAKANPMTNILVGPQALSDPTAASPACREAATGRAPTWWTAQRGEDPRSETFRALAWSQDDSPADPLPYEGEDYVVPQADASMPWYRGAARLYVIAAGAAAVAFGGLVLSTNGVENAVTTIPITVTQRPSIAPDPALDRQAADQVGAAQSVAPVPPAAPPQPAAPPARVIRTDSNDAAPATISSTAVASSPAEDVVPDIAKPEVTSVAAPAPVDGPPAAPSSVDEPSLVSLPVVTPQPVPHPVGPPPDIHVPTEPAGSNPVVAGPPVISDQPSPWAAHPGITLPPHTVVIPQVPVLIDTPVAIGGAG